MGIIFMGISGYPTIVADALEKGRVCESLMMDRRQSRVVFELANVNH